MKMDNCKKLFSPAVLILLVAAALAVVGGCAMAQRRQHQLAVSLPNAAERQTIQVKTGYATVQGMSYTNKDNSIQRAPSYTIHLANFDQDARDAGRYLNNLPKANEQTKVIINLIGEEGDGPTSMPRSGSYAPKADKFRKVRMMTVQTRSGDKTEEFNLTPDATGGEVKIKAVRGTGKGEKIIEGEIDVTQGDRVIKGSFAATVVGTK